MSVPGPREAEHTSNAVVALRLLEIALRYELGTKRIARKEHGSSDLPGRSLDVNAHRATLSETKASRNRGKRLRRGEPLATSRCFMV